MTVVPIQYIESQPSLTGRVDGTLWQESDPIPISQFLWCDPDQKPRVVARLLYDDENLFIQYQVDSDHIYANTSTLNGPVWEDSCVELFTAVDPTQRKYYLNFELNCLGTIHCGVGDNRTDRDLITQEIAESIRVRTSISGQTKTPAEDDEHWWAAIAIPYRALAALTGTSISPKRGTIWYGNLHYLRSEPTPIFAAWNPVETAEPNFHHPSAFGTFVFK